jgi:hypothetical protein
MYVNHLLSMPKIPIEVLIRNQKVGGSIPPVSTKKNKQLASVKSRGFLLSGLRVATM